MAAPVQHVPRVAAHEEAAHLRGSEQSVGRWWVVGEAIPTMGLLTRRGEARYSPWPYLLWPYLLWPLLAMALLAMALLAMALLAIALLAMAVLTRAHLLRTEAEAERAQGQQLLALLLARRVRVVPPRAERHVARREEAHPAADGLAVVGG